jgi:hypothetical protein
MSQSVSLIDFARFCFCGALAGISIAGTIGIPQSPERDFVCGTLGILTVAALRMRKVL